MKTIFLILSLLFSGNTSRELIPNISSPQQVIWKDTYNVIFVKDEYIFNYNWVTKKVENIGIRNANDFIGLDENNNIEICTIQHFMISSPKEYSTIFKVKEKELKIFPTIRPISLKGDTIAAVTALDFLEQHYYKISISSGEINEIEKPKEERNNNLYVEEDMFGNLYINYNVRNLLLNFIRILIHQLALYLGI